MPVPDLPPPPPPIQAPAPEALVARERVDPGEEVADFNPGDWDLKVRLGFSGNSYSPLTLFSAFLNWFDLQLVADRGVWERDYLSIGVGVEAFVGRPWLPEATSTLRSDGGADLSWRAATHGLAFRGTAHYTWLSAFDPYVVVLAGPTVDTVRAVRADRAAVGRFTTGGLRLGAGVGASYVSADRILGGLELRYLVAPRFRSGTDIPLVTPGGDTLDRYDVGRAQRPPRGFSWVFYVGIRL
jgi:hypothetical protein